MLLFLLLLQELERKFMKYGHVREARVVRNPVTGESRGFGFVIMSSEEEVEDVGCFCCVWLCSDVSWIDPFPF